MVVCFCLFNQVFREEPLLQVFLWPNESKGRNVGSLLDTAHFVLGTTHCYEDVVEHESSNFGNEEKGETASKL